MLKELISISTAVFTALSSTFVISENGVSILPENSIIIENKVYTLTFEDEFNGTELDSEKWEHCPEGKRQDTDNYWQDDMAYLDGEGNLIITMSWDEENERHPSGAVRTKGKFEQTYGYFEIRCTVNTIPGYWTAFWLMGDSVMSEMNGGRDGTEIDIFETPFCDTSEVQNTLNWDGYGSQHKALGNVTNVPGLYNGDYHTFALLWTETEYVFYCDGKETWRTDAQKARGTCEVPLYLKISAETGTWANGGNIDNALLPDIMKVDYVRVYAPEK